MKKAIILSVILCFSLSSTKYVKSLVFAEPSNKTSIIKQNESTIDDSQPIVNQNNLTQEQAKNLLIKYNDTVNYIYQGDENNFEALKSKNLHGYVFLPDVETDIGFFVDKETSHIYFFHPSGYLELAQ